MCVGALFGCRQSCKLVPLSSVVVVVELVRVVDGCARLRYGDDNAGETKRRIKAMGGCWRLTACVEHQRGGDTGTGTGALWLMVESRCTTARWETDQEPADEELEISEAQEQSS